MTNEERHQKQQTAPQLPLDDRGIADCCKVPSNLALTEYRPDVVAVWTCRCSKRHFRAFMPLNMLNVPIG